MKFYYYKITNIKNGSFYIGITTNFLKRQHQHFYQLQKNIHHNYKMQEDYNIYGVDAFKMEIIDEMEGSEEEAYQHEYNLIQSLQTTQFYNISEGGHTNPVYSPQVIEKLKKTHQAKYENILQYTFDGKHFHLVASYDGYRDACRKAGLILGHFKK